MRVEFWGDDGRGGPLLHGRRPALAGVGRARAVGAAVPRAAAHPQVRRARRSSWPRSTPSWRRCSTRSPTGRPWRAWRRWPRCSSTTCGCCCTSCRPAPCPGLRPRAGADPGRRAGRAPPRSSWTHPGRPRPVAAGADRPGRGRAAHAGPGPRDRGRARHPVVDAEPVRGRRPSLDDGRRAADPTRRRPRSIAATPTRAIADVQGLDSATAGGSCWSSTATARRSAPSSSSAARRSRRAACRPVGRPGAGRRHRLHRLLAARLRRDPGCKLAVLDRGRHHRPARPSTKDMRRMPSRRAQRGRPAAAQGRRPRRARAARRRPVRRDGAADGQRRRARVPHPRVRPGQARSARRPAVRADRLPRPGHPVRRRRGARRSTGSAAPTGQKTKGRARKAVKEIAGELIRLYSARMATKGHAFGPDSPWQRELEDAFPYVETPDQLAAIDEVKPTWSRSCRWTAWSAATSATARPRSRCGRRSRRCRTASRWPCWCRRRCSPSSTSRRSPSGWRSSRSPSRRCRRFQPDGEAEADARGPGRRARSTSSSAPTGCCSRTTRFKDLGLVVVDEEQRFGVEHKEYLKTLRTAVDVLDHVGDADPAHPGDVADRHPGDVDDPDPAGGAAPGAHVRRRRTTRSRSPPPIRRELLREGQVFFIHNRVRLDRAGRRPAPRAGARGPGRRRARADGRGRAGAGHGRLLGEGASTCWSARRSSSPAWTSRTPTR